MIVKFSWLLQTDGGSRFKKGSKANCVLYIPEKDFNPVVCGISLVVMTA